MDRLESLVNVIGHSAALAIIDSQIVYPTTTSLDEDKALFCSEFEGGLDGPIRDIQSDINLKAIDQLVVRDAISLLSMINELKDSVLLSSADKLVVYKGGFNIIELKNNSKPESGRSILVEINSCRKHMICLAEETREKTNKNWEIACMIVVAAALVTIVQVLKHN